MKKLSQKEALELAANTLQKNGATKPNINKTEYNKIFFILNTLFF